jgi:hypothetical protein
MQAEQEKCPPPPPSTPGAWSRPSGALVFCDSLMDAQGQILFAPQTLPTSFTDTQTCTFVGLIGHNYQLWCWPRHIRRCLAVATIDWLTLCRCVPFRSSGRNPV